MFKLVNYTLRLLILITFIIASPFFLIVCIAMSNSFKEAIKVTIELVTLPMQDLNT